MIRTLLKFRNNDSTLDLNDQFSKFFSRGIVFGGDVVPVSGQLSVDVTPFKLMGVDGMAVLESSNTTRLNVTANQTSVVVFKSQYIPNDVPVYGFEVLEISVYNGRSDKDYLCVFAVITLGSGATEVLTGNISYDLRDVLDPITRSNSRGSLTSSSLLPTSHNRPGDYYAVTSGLGDTPAFYMWNGTGWINVTDSLIVASLLSAHRNNLFSNEIHLTDNQAAAAVGSAGTVGDTNRYVTEQDTRLPSQGESDALVGFPSTPAPDGTNPFVTAAFSLAQPVSLSFGANPGVLFIPPSSGPIYVGTSGPGTPLQYFKLYHASLPREFVTSTGAVVTLTGIFKDAGLTQPIVPSSDPAILADNGFYTGSAFLTYSTIPDKISRLCYGQKKALNTIDRGALLLQGPQSAQTSQETLERLTEISGYEFGPGSPQDVAVPTPAQNINLRSDLDLVEKYLDAVTASDLVVDSAEFPRLRNYTKTAADFPANFGEIVKFSGGTFSVVPPTTANLSQYTAFDAYYSSLSLLDVGQVTLIRYSAASDLSAVQPGHIFIDGQGNRFRVLQVNPSYGNGALMVFNGANTPFNIPAFAQNGQILAANNPRHLEVLSDHETYLVEDFIPVDSVVPNPGMFETLPPGGNYVGAGALYTMVGQDALPVQGASTGARQGRPTFNISPKIQNNRYEKRVLLIGSWRNDPVNYPRAALGEVGPDTCAIEYTGRISDLTLYTSLNGDMPYGFRVFIDGVYAGDSVAKFLSGVVDSITGETASSVSANYLAGQNKLQSLSFSLGLSDSNIHTVRVEVTEEGLVPFELYGIGVRYNLGLLEEAGRSFVQTNLVKLDTTSIVSNPVIPSDHTITATAQPLRNKGLKTLRYIGQDGLRHIATRLYTEYGGTGGTHYTVSGGSTSFTTGLDSTLYGNLKVGDVLRFSARRLEVFAGGYGDPAEVIQYLRVVNISETGWTVDAPANSTIAAIGSDPNRGNSLEFVYRVPSKVNDGSAVASAPESDDEQEYLRLYPEDWSVGLDSDVANLSTAAPDTKVTTLDDGQTTLLVRNGTLVSTNLEGFGTGVSLASTTAYMTISGWGSGMDVVFCSNSGGTATVDVEIDGVYSYTLTIPLTGVVRHSLFFKAAAQTHTVKLSNPSAANAIVVGAWIFSELKTPDFVGTAIAEYTQVRPNNAYYYAFGISDYTQLPYITPPAIHSDCVNSDSGYTVLHPLKVCTFYEGISGSPWAALSDYTNLSRYGVYAQSSATNAVIEVEFYGNSVEFYFLANPAGGYASVSIDGIDAADITPNQVNLGSVTGTTRDLHGPGLDPASEYYDALSRLSFYSASPTVKRFSFALPPTGTAADDLQRHVLRIQGPGSNNGGSITDPSKDHDASSSGININVVAVAYRIPFQSVAKRNAEDTANNRIHRNVLVDRRSFITLNPNQVGVASGAEATVASVTQTESLPASPKQPATGFQWLSYDTFTASPGVLTLSPQTTAAYAPQNYYALSCDKSKTVSTSGTTFTLSGTPSYTIAVGDIIYDNASGVFRRIASLTSQTQGLLDAAFASNLASSACMVSQAVWTKDLVNLGDSTQATRPRDFYPATSIPTVHIEYRDSLTAGDTVADLTAAANVVVSASNSGLSTDTSTFPLTSTFATYQARPTLPASQINDYSLLSNANQQRLFLVFFCNPANGSVTSSANLLSYDCSFYAQAPGLNGGYLNSAYCMSDSSGTPVNCSNPQVVSGASEVQLTWDFTLGLNSGQTTSDLEVRVNGQVIPRQVVGTTQDAYWTEIQGNTRRIRLWTDLSGVSYSIEIVRRQGSLDVTSVNSSKISAQWKYIVGSAAQVTVGIANYSSLQSAITAASAGDSILVLSGTISEAITLNKRLFIMGQGYDTRMTGNWTVTNGSVYSSVRCLWVDGSLTLNSGANGNIFDDNFYTSPAADSGTGNLIKGVIV